MHGARPLLAVLTTLPLLLATAPAEACICYFMQQEPSVEEKLLEADVVFVGRALFWETDAADYQDVLVRNLDGTGERIRFPPHRALAEVDVERVFKGPVASTIVVSVDEDGGSCGNALEPDVTYLVFASMYDGRLVVDGCASDPLEHAADEYLTLVEMTRQVERQPYRLGGSPHLGWPPGPTCAASGPPSRRGLAVALCALAAAFLCRRMGKKSDG